MTPQTTWWNAPSRNSICTRCGLAGTTDENGRFYEQVFDLITPLLEAPQGASILDAGCGNGQHALRLARRGFQVEAVDFSPAALALAEESIGQSSFRERIQMQGEDLTALSFADARFCYALCWGVLMHIPAVQKAVAELSRVIRPGGWLVVSEANRTSLQSWLLRVLGVILRREKTRVVKTPAGTEYWSVNQGDAILTREADIPWLVRQFQQHGLALKRRLPGQFTEAYVRFSNRRLRAMVHGLNQLWFQRIRVPQLAFGNVLVFQKTQQNGEA